VRVNGTPESEKQRIIDYYAATTETSYIPNWGGDALGFHFGLADEGTSSLSESVANTNAYLADRARVSAGSRVLDAGCGVGGSAIWLARERGAKVMGVSLVERQIELARGFARERAVGALVEFEVRDMAATGFAEGSFDVVWNLESLCHITDLEGYLGHVWELLEGGGRFACIDVCSGPNGDADVSRTVCDGWALAALRSTAQIASALESRGFRDIEVVDLTPRALLSARALESMASRSLLELRTEQSFFGRAPRPAYEGHVRAGLAMAQGMSSGTTSLGHVLARRPARQ
jgi:SAM-dependent methyltransferase